MAASEQYRLLMADVYELAGLSRRTSAAIAKELGQTVARWHVLSVVSAGPSTVPAIARRLGLTRQGVQRVADDLLAAHLLKASPNPDHVRSPLLYRSVRRVKVPRACDLDRLLDPKSSLRRVIVFRCENDPD